jgi:hypothetical protein
MFFTSGVPHNAQLCSYASLLLFHLEPFWGVEIVEQCERTCIRLLQKVRRKLLRKITFVRSTLRKQLKALLEQLTPVLPCRMVQLY